MKPRPWLFGVVLFFNFSLSAHAQESQAVGYYSNGSILHSVEFPSETDAVLKIFRHRDRGWATEALIDLIENAAQQVHDLFPAGERLQIADASQEGGGKITGHASHQNGLDIDLVFYRMDRFEEDPERSGGLNEHFIADGKLTENFDLERNWLFIDALVKTKKVNRIFVDEKIKQALCRYARDEGLLADSEETLRRLRHWPHHTNHLHVRFSCPSTSPNCLSQSLPPSGTGCVFN